MKQRKPLTDIDGEVRELTEDDFALMKPLADVMPAEFVAMVTAHQKEMEKQGKIRTGRGKQKAPTKQSVTLRLSPEVIQAFRATGQGWQTRINEVLLNYIKTA
ncbi:BrnA antitoxin family protein [Rodentibacter trehalosifermentans]|uniref:Toxin-antitoxin system, antitoxin component n=1 Tax=Rodentibacter trehalosifermentans TaxID=1908263 RepID=A0A1V3IMM8_9PAST|nr:BrnA antitoxin family protein [Rodentibacter trehalosifermentans]OOF43106.1 toxin-antitoxin system, antitoxin component [Rodentibacter trehalosifermentans]OOF46018.1 toxin-antitoxin system, antitoxin component [Rodentibacter trehalosifermentans]OOF53053.1 toxin-antitoxin system, antitoxin component [Rodentibacter trehalosifermentans]